MVMYLALTGAEGYTFKVVDNDTIDVTEIEEIREGGSFVLGDTAPFTRVSGSTVNKTDKPTVLNHPYIGKWRFAAQGMEIPKYGPGTHNILVNYEAKADGTLAYDFTLDDNPPMSESTPYFIFDNILVVYSAEEGIETATIIPSGGNTIYLLEEGEEAPVPLTRIP
jgi:hypothetical protein